MEIWFHFGMGLKYLQVYFMSTKKALLRGN